MLHLYIRNIYDSILINIDKDGNIITYMLDAKGQIIK